MNSGGKAFLVLITFVLMIAIFASGSMSQADLTPSSITIPGENRTVNLPDTGSSSRNIIADTSLNPGSAPCGDSYTVQRGDTLSSIARACSLSIEGIMAINPSITNANLIVVGQKLSLYLPPAPTAVAAQSVVADQQALMAAAAASTPVHRGLIPGGSVDVQISGMRAGRQVIVTFSKQGEPGVQVGEGITDDQGSLNLDITIPTSAKVNEQYLVVITDKDDPSVRVISQMITIE